MAPGFGGGLEHFLVVGLWLGSSWFAPCFRKESDCSVGYRTLPFFGVPSFFVSFSALFCVREYPVSFLMIDRDVCTITFMLYVKTGNVSMSNNSRYDTLPNKKISLPFVEYIGQRNSIVSLPIIRRES